MAFFLELLRRIFCCGQEGEEEYLLRAGQRHRASSSSSSYRYFLLGDSDIVAKIGNPKPTRPWNYLSSSPVGSTLPSEASLLQKVSPSPRPESVKRSAEKVPKSPLVSKPSPPAPSAGPVNYQKSSPVSQVGVESSKGSKENQQNVAPHTHGNAPLPSTQSVWKESGKKTPDKQPKVVASHSVRSVKMEYVKEKDKTPEIVRSQGMLAGSSVFVNPSGSNPPGLPKRSPESGSDSPGLPKKSPESLKKKAVLPVYAIPEHLKDLIKKDKVPEVLRRPLSPSTYADYFATLLYAEDFYIEKWSKFLLTDVTLELQTRKIKDANRSILIEEKDFVAFEIDSVPERRPYLLSRDFVLLRPSGKKCEPFQGVLFRVEKSTTVLVEFGDDFHAQYSPTKKYDVSFSFNRACLKRCHQAVAAVLDSYPSLCDILFPNSVSIRFPFYRNFNQDLNSLVNHIVNLKGPLPYLIEGPVSETPPSYKHLSITGDVILQAVLQLCRTSNNCRILICAPRNRTCDALTIRLFEEIPKSILFRANAAFREYFDVPDDVRPSCLYEGENFTCPPLSELQSFKVITSTFMSSFRLRVAGIGAGHFTHIFLVDASSSIEPEAVVALTNLVSEKTSIVVTGSSRDYPKYVRADIARRNGLKSSYFHRLLNREPYVSSDPMFITHLNK